MKSRGQGGSSKESPSTSPPPVGGPVRKHKSRDSGFVGSNDDLLRNEANGGQVLHTSSDENVHAGNSSEGENAANSSTGGTTPATTANRLEKVSEVSENTEDDSCDRSS